MHFAYIRWSSDEQAKGDSERRQLQAARAYASKSNLELRDENILIDPGLSAFTGENVSRGKLGQFLKDVEAGKIPRGACLITENLDRLSRQNINITMDILRGLMKAGIDVHTIKDGHVYKAKDFGIMDHMMSGMGAYLSNLESAKKRDRLNAAWENKRKNIHAKKLTARCPEWLKLTKDRTDFVKNEQREKIVRSIFTDAANGLGCYTIVRRLNEQRIPPFGRGRKNKQGVQGWHSSSVLKILTNRAVLGEFQPHRRNNGKREKVGEVHKDYYPAIIDEELFLRAQAAREGRRIKSAAVKKGKNVANLFSGLLKCAYCQSTMRFENKGFGSKGGTYLVCDNARRGFKCEKARWKYSDFEASFIEFCEELDIAALVGGDKEEQERLKLSHEIEATEAKIASLESARDAFLETLEKVKTTSRDYIAGKVDEKTDQIADAKAMLESKEEQELNALRSKPVDTEELKKIISQLQGNGDYLLRAQIAAEIRKFVETIVMAPAGDVPLIPRALEQMKKDGIDLSTVGDPTEHQHEKWFRVHFKDRFCLWCLTLIIPGNLRRHFR